MEEIRGGKCAEERQKKKKKDRIRYKGKEGFERGGEEKGEKISPSLAC